MGSGKKRIAPFEEVQLNKTGLPLEESIYNITTFVNSVVCQRIAESKARDLLKLAGYSYPQELDWLALSPQNNWLCIEVKHKSRLFYPPPFWGIGLDVKQVFLRNKILERLSIQCFLLAYCEGQVYGQFLSILESGRKYTTRKGILVFPIEAFFKGDTEILTALNGVLHAS